MPRAYNTLGRRILAVLETGPRKATVLAWMAPEKRLKATLERLLKNKLIVALQKPRAGGTHYALAKRKT